MRRLASLSVFALVAAAGLYMGATPAQADDGEKCSTTDFKTAQVKKACADGGRDGAKALMKKLVKKAKDAGQEINCKSCHKSLSTFEQTDNALADLKKLL